MADKYLRCSLGELFRCSCPWPEGEALRAWTHRVKDVRCMQVVKVCVWDSLRVACVDNRTSNIDDDFSTRLIVTDLNA